jgi:haloalkane dehalogenase
MTEEISAAFPFESKFLEVRGSRMHYVEQGVGDPILFLHGNPTSSYLWRNVLPHVSGEGRCIAPDLIGMGKSDKPDLEYRFFEHANYVERFIDGLGLANITLVIHDWGSGLGFHYAALHPDKIKAIAFMEAILLPVPSWDAFPSELREIFQSFRTDKVGWDLIVNQNVFIEKILPGGVVRELAEDEMNAYREPYLEPETRKPLWRWPNEIPIGGEPSDVNEAVLKYNAQLVDWDIPKLLFYAEPGAILPKPTVEWCEVNLKNLTTINLGKGLHYLQEDHPHAIGEGLVEWYRGL